MVDVIFPAFIDFVVMMLLVDKKKGNGVIGSAAGKGYHSKTTSKL